MRARVNVSLLVALAAVAVLFVTGYGCALYNHYAALR